MEYRRKLTSTHNSHLNLGGGFFLMCSSKCSEGIENSRCWCSSLPLRWCPTTGKGSSGSWSKAEIGKTRPNTMWFYSDHSLRAYLAVPSWGALMYCTPFNGRQSRCFFHYMATVQTCKCPISPTHQWERVQSLCLQSLGHVLTSFGIYMSPPRPVRSIVRLITETRTLTDRSIQSRGLIRWAHPTRHPPIMLRTARVTITPQV